MYICSVWGEGNCYRVFFSCMTMPVLTKETLFELELQAVNHPPCSPDFALCDFYLFRFLKEALGSR